MRTVAWLSRCAAFGVPQALILIFLLPSPASAETVDGVGRVIDMSGDRSNNQDGPVTTDLDIAIGEGVTIDGLPPKVRPDVAKRVSPDAYYSNRVIGGPLSFIPPVRRREQFPETIRRKLLLELTAGSVVWRTCGLDSVAAVNAVGGNGRHDWRKTVEGLGG